MGKFGGVLIIINLQITYSWTNVNHSKERRAKILHSVEKRRVNLNKLNSS